MEQLQLGYFEGRAIEYLNKSQLEAAILYIDKQIDAETDNNRVIQYCILKVDFINKLMAIDKMDRRNYLG